MVLPFDGRGRRSVKPGVGGAALAECSGNGDGYASGPSAVAVSTGTGILWDGTGEGGQHDVVANPDEQIGDTDFEFSSGEPGQDNEDVRGVRGRAVSLRAPPLGMEGAVVVK